VDNKQIAQIKKEFGSLNYYDFCSKYPEVDLPYVKPSWNKMLQIIKNKFLTVSFNDEGPLRDELIARLKNSKDHLETFISNDEMSKRLGFLENKNEDKS
jgi:hypothetical protein